LLEVLADPSESVTLVMNRVAHLFFF
jgi:hypothetical protein